MIIVAPIKDDLAGMKVIGFAGAGGAGLTEYGASLPHADHCAECERDACPACGSPTCNGSPTGLVAGPCENTP